MYAIVEAAGKQGKVSSGDQIKIDNIEGELNSEVMLNKVLTCNSLQLAAVRFIDFLR